MLSFDSRQQRRNRTVPFTKGSQSRIGPLIRYEKPVLVDTLRVVLNTSQHIVKSERNVIRCEIGKPERAPRRTVGLYLNAAANCARKTKVVETVAERCFAIDRHTLQPRSG